MNHFRLQNYGAGFGTTLPFGCNLLHIRCIRYTEPFVYSFRGEFKSLININLQDASGLMRFIVNEFLV